MVHSARGPTRSIPRPPGLPALLRPAHRHHAHVPVPRLAVRRHDRRSPPGGPRLGRSRPTRCVRRTARSRSESDHASTELSVWHESVAREPRQTSTSVDPAVSSEPRVTYPERVKLTRRRRLPSSAGSNQTEISAAPRVAGDSTSSAYRAQPRCPGPRSPQERQCLLPARQQRAPLSQQRTSAWSSSPSSRRIR